MVAFYNKIGYTIGGKNVAREREGVEPACMSCGSRAGNSFFFYANTLTVQLLFVRFHFFRKKFNSIAQDLIVFSI